jgi:hypothetical protein
MVSCVEAAYLANSGEATFEDERVRVVVVEVRLPQIC